jgi:DNA-binding NarL/FixJ family response regulator
MAFGRHLTIETSSLLEEAKNILDRHTFDLIVSDLHLPDGSGIDLIRKNKASQYPCPCIVATIFSDREHLFPALQAGADGYLLKDEGKDEIAALLTGIMKGKPPISPSVAQQMLHFFHQQPKSSLAEHPPLTHREKEILLYISKGMSTRECAELMGISTHTASEHIQKVYRKLGIHSRAEAVMEAVNMGIS